MLSKIVNKQCCTCCLRVTYMPLPNSIFGTDLKNLQPLLIEGLYLHIQCFCHKRLQIHMQSQNFSQSIQSRTVTIIFILNDYHSSLVLSEPVDFRLDGFLVHDQWSHEGVVCYAVKQITINLITQNNYVTKYVTNYVTIGLPVHTKFDVLILVKIK